MRISRVRGLVLPQGNLVSRYWAGKWIESPVSLWSYRRSGIFLFLRTSRVFCAVATRCLLGSLSIWVLGLTGPSRLLQEPGGGVATLRARNILTAKTNRVSGT